MVKVKFISWFSTFLKCFLNLTKPYIVILMREIVLQPFRSPIVNTAGLRASNPVHLKSKKIPYIPLTGWTHFLNPKKVIPWLFLILTYLLYYESFIDHLISFSEQSFHLKSLTELYRFIFEQYSFPILSETPFSINIFPAINSLAGLCFQWINPFNYSSLNRNFLSAKNIRISRFN